MKNFIIIVLSICVTTQIHAGEACCGVGKKASKSPDKNSGTLIKTDAQSVACSFGDLSHYISNGKTLTTNDLQNLIKSKANIVLVDARTPKWDDGRRIASAKNLTPQSSESEIAAVISSKDSYIVTYCGSTECPLSHKMADRLKGLGYSNTLVYPEGVAGWTKAGNAIH